jgi:hypothetical protein
MLYGIIEIKNLFFQKNRILYLFDLFFDFFAEPAVISAYGYQESFGQTEYSGACVAHVGALGNEISLHGAAYHVGYAYVKAVFRAFHSAAVLVVGVDLVVDPD